MSSFSGDVKIFSGIMAQPPPPWKNGPYAYVNVISSCELSKIWDKKRTVGHS